MTTMVLGVPKVLDAAKILLACELPKRLSAPDTVKVLVNCKISVLLVEPL